MSTLKTDVELVQQLFSDELSIQGNIISCQRLGKPSSGKTQLLKVCTSGTKEAADVLAAAKRLRNSADSYTSKNIFINRDMTKSEAEAAYQARCRRRHKDGNRQQQQQQPSTATTYPTASPQLTLPSVPPQIMPVGRHN
jgi:hypothetical protein